MKALISPNEVLGNGVRVAEVAQQEFEVAPPLFWVNCPDDAHADMIYVDGQFVEPEPESISEPEPTPTPPSGDTPVTET